MLVSNGHGEDLSGSILAVSLKRLGHQVEALPLVGKGNSYVKAGIETIGSSRDFSTGGLGYTSIRGRFTELMQGQIFYLIKRLLRLIRVAKYYDLLLVVGDIVPVCAAWLSRRPVATYLVAYSSHYEGLLRLPWPCSFFLKNDRFLAIYSRDQLTAEDLTQQLRKRVLFLGNPFMDPVLSPKESLMPLSEFRLGLLPGSRIPELEENLLLILRVIECLPKGKIQLKKISFDMALVEAVDDDRVQELIADTEWRLIDNESNFGLKKLVNGHYQVNIQRNSFIDVLKSSDVLLSMAGTATEQAIGLAKPVLQLVGSGPQFTNKFAEAQRRLLGPTVFCVDSDCFDPERFTRTAELAISLLLRSKSDTSLKSQCQQQANRRLGPLGGAEKMAYGITNLLT